MTTEEQDALDLYLLIERTEVTYDELCTRLDKSITWAYIDNNNHYYEWTYIILKFINVPYKIGLSLINYKFCNESTIHLRRLVWLYSQ